MGLVKLLNRLARGRNSEKPVAEEKWAHVRGEPAAADAESAAPTLTRVKAHIDLRAAANRAAACPAPNQRPADGEGEGEEEGAAVAVGSPRPVGLMFRRRNGFAVPHAPLVYSPVLTLAPSSANTPVHLCKHFFDSEDLEDVGEATNLPDGVARRLHTRRNALPGAAF